MLYLVDKPYLEIAQRTIPDDPDAVVVLIQDGVLCAPGFEAPTYAVERDVAVRGADTPADVEPVSYDTLMEMVLEQPVTSFV